MEKKEKYICISINSLFKGILAIVILAGAIFVLFLPRTDLFKGSLIRTEEPVQEQVKVEEKEAGSIVVEYIKQEDEIDVESGAKDVSLSKMAFKAGEEPVEISGITLELEGNANRETFANMYLSFNNERMENVEFIWLSDSSLFIDIVNDPLEVTEYAEIEFFADLTGNESEKRFGFHFVEVVAEGIDSGKEITNVGLNGTLDPVPLFINFK